jgi:bacterioferritin-associated ferredoxin
VILCLCRGVSDHAVDAVISAGARTVEDIERACGAGGDCGACGQALACLVERVRERHYSGATAVH